MKKKHFIQIPGEWKGGGKMKLNISEEPLFFTTHWDVAKADASGKIRCLQEVKIEGVSAITKNNFSFYDIKGDSFRVDLETESLGKVTGNGLFTDKGVAWELALPDLGFGGFEFYQQENDAYTMRAEYATNDHFRSEVEGRISPVKKEPSP